MQVLALYLRLYASYDIAGVSLYCSLPLSDIPTLILL